MIVGVYILVRSLRSLYTTFQNPDYIQVNQKENFRYRYLLCCSLLVVSASVFSLLLHSEFMAKIHYILKVPVFTLGKIINNIL